MVVKTVSIIGIGRVGGALALTLPKLGFKVENLVFRNRKVPEPIAKTAGVARLIKLNALDSLSSEIIFITTQDYEIASVCESLVDKIRNRPIVFHTSGSLSSEILSPLALIGSLTGSIHPLVSISSSEFGEEGFKNSYFCVEGMPDAVSAGQEIVRALGGIPFSIKTEFKTLYHASAVTACGHLVALFDAALEMMGNCGLTAEQSQKILMPLVCSTIKNLERQTPSRALTGTFARADIETFNEHLKALNRFAKDDLLEIYLLLGERSLELAAREGVSAERIERLRAKVSIAKSKIKW